jgi:hypothetical protein
MVPVQPVPKQYLNIEVIAVLLCLDMVDFSFNLAVEKVQFGIPAENRYLGLKVTLLGSLAINIDKN